MLPHPGQIIKPYWQEKYDRQPGFSLRALARSLKLSPTYVSQVFNCKRTPSFKALNEFIRILKISKSDARILKQATVLHSKAQQSAARVLEEYLKNDPESHRYYPVRKKPPQSLSGLNRWYHFALLDLITCEDYQGDERWLAQRLKLTLSETNEALHRLALSGLIARHSHKWIKTETHLEFPCDSSHEFTRMYHREMSLRAINVMSHQLKPQDLERRRMVGATMAINPAAVPQAIQELNRFLSRLVKRLGDFEGANEVYQINLQLFPLSQQSSDGINHQANERSNQRMRSVK